MRPALGLGIKEELLRSSLWAPLSFSTPPVTGNSWRGRPGSVVAGGVGKRRSFCLTLPGGRGGATLEGPEEASPRKSWMEDVRSGRRQACPSPWDKGMTAALRAHMGRTWSQMLVQRPRPQS